MASPGSSGTAGAAGSVHPRGGYRAVPGTDLGAAAKGAACIPVRGSPAPGDAQGDPELRQALAENPAQYRGVRCGAHQIVVGAGLEYLLGLLAPLLPGPAAVGITRLPAGQTGAGKQRGVLPLPAGGPGGDVGAGAGGLRCGGVLCDPQPSVPHRSHQLPAPRRTELLHWAARGQGRRLIIEDDYDSEFRFDTRPCPACRAWRGRDGAGGVSVHLFPEPCPRHPHCVYGPAGASAARAAGLRPLCGHGGPL